MPLTAALALALGLAVGVTLGGCGETCAKVYQRFVLESPDDELQALVDDCVATRACQPLCQRVLEISDQFPGTSSIEKCSYAPASAFAPDAGAAAFGAVDVVYRPSSCP